MEDVARRIGGIHTQPLAGRVLGGRQRRKHNQDAKRRNNLHEFLRLQKGISRKRVMVIADFIKNQHCSRCRLAGQQHGEDRQPCSAGLIHQRGSTKVNLAEGADF
jgi:hypothetical protein